MMVETVCMAVTTGKNLRDPLIRSKDVSIGIVYDKAICTEQKEPAETVLTAAL